MNFFEQINCVCFELCVI